MTTMRHTPTAADRVAELREDVAEAERQMGIHFGTPLYATYLAQRGEAQREIDRLEAQ